MIFRSVVSMAEQCTASDGFSRTIPNPFWCMFVHHQLMEMSIVVLGIAVGLVAVVPPGPISMLLVEVGVAQGRGRGARGGLGIALGELVVVVLALTAVGAGAALPASLFGAVRVASAGLILTFGVLLMARPEVCRQTAGSIRRPLRTMFLITALTPTVFGSWIAILTAMPFAAERAMLWTFAAAAVVASTCWHVGLGVVAGAVRGRLDPATMVRVSRAGGAAMVAFGGWAVFA